MSDTAPTSPMPEEPVSAEIRKNHLAQAIQREVAAGQRVESQSDFNAILVAGKPVNHTLHLILTIITCSLWGIVWLGLALIGGEKRIILQVDDYGNVLRQQATR